MNSSSQPCNAVASVAGWKGNAPITVYGPVAQMACSVSATRIAADGGASAGGITTARISLKDANGNLVANAYAPAINVINVTPSLAQMSPVGLVAPSAGVATVTITSTTTPGDIQVSASAPGLTGCNAVVTSTAAGAATKTSATLLQSPIAADSVSTTTLQVDVTDANGLRVLSDNLTQLAVTLQGSTSVCRFVGVTQGTSPSLASSFVSALAYQGRAAFTVQSAGTPGQCLFVVTTNNSSIAGTSATLLTQTVGAPARLVVLSNAGICDLSSSPSDPSCTKIVVGVADANGVLLTGDSGRVIVLTVSPSLCSGAGGDVLQRGSTSTSSGKATFAFSSAGAYSGCAISFSSTNLAGVTTNAVWTPGTPDHLSCAMSPTSLPSNSNPVVRGTVSVRDSLNNVATAGTLSVVLTRTAGSATTLLTGGPQYTVGGTAGFDLARQGSNVGVDTYTPALSAGTLPNVLPNSSCTVIAQ
jgi:hypothetical protein